MALVDKLLSSKLFSIIEHSVSLSVNVGRRLNSLITSVGDPDGADRNASERDGLALEKLEGCITHVLLCQFLKNFA